MQFQEIGQSIRFNIKNAAYLRFDRVSEYQNIISPFSRMYLVTEGEGYILNQNEKTKLEAGYIYLIPSYAPCSYLFNQDLSHYYIHFSMNMENGLSIYGLFNIHNKFKATELDRALFARLLEINPDLPLPHHDPKVYQNKPWANKKVVYRSMGHLMETVGIIEQLFSRFIQEESVSNIPNYLNLHMQEILVYIQKNIANNIAIEELAQMACTSKDHFTRVFKSITGIAPCEFIIRKRIEKAQYLLLTSDLSQKQIIDEVGIKSVAYLCRIFKKYTNYTPEEYRNQRTESI